MTGMLASVLEASFNTNNMPAATLICETLVCLCACQTRHFKAWTLKQK